MATTTPNYGWPVPTSTDLVKDGAVAIEALGDAIDATVFALPTAAGIGSNVVTGVQSTVMTTTSTTYADTNLTATITPTSATSKILVIVSQPTLTQRATASNIAVEIKLFRNAVDLGKRGILAISGGVSGAGVIKTVGVISFCYLDSPATTSAVVYKTQAAITETTNSPIATVNSDSTASSMESTITLIEVAA